MSGWSPSRTRSINPSLSGSRVFWFGGNLFDNDYPHRVAPLYHLSS